MKWSDMENPKFDSRSTDILSENLIPEIWPSIARIAATFGIFLFHYLGFSGSRRYDIDFWAILVFCFLTGYLAQSRVNSPNQWIVRKYFSIMVSYWLIIVPALLLNRCVQYKDTDMFSDIVTLVGGNLFLRSPVYVIAWYITFVLLLYVHAYFSSIFGGKCFIIFFLIGFLFFGVYLNKMWYFISYSVGLWISKDGASKVKNLRKGKKTKYLTVKLFGMQKYCYSFFLVNGSIQLFLFREGVTGLMLFISSAIVSIILSMLVYQLSKPMEVFAAKKVVSLFEKTQAF